MQAETALAIYTRLEREEYVKPATGDEEEYRTPVFDVRLDATVKPSTDERQYRVRVGLGQFAELAHVRLVLDVAEQYDVMPDIQNSGFELR